jgi:tetratricopeptide (TPR) repeat protein
MKNLLFLLFTTLSVSIFANTDLNPKDSVTGVIDKAACLVKIDEGKKIFLERRYRDALIVFKEASVKDPNSWKPDYWLSQCHYNLKNYGYAKKYAEESLRKGGKETDPEVFDVLGGSYQRLNSLDTAQIYYQRALTYIPKNRAKELEIERKIASVAYAKEEGKVENKRVSLSTEINTNYNDYSPVISADGKTMYFTSRKSNTTGGRLNPDDQEYFEDVYRAKWNDVNKIWDSVTNKLERINSTGFDNLCWISADGLKAVTVWNNTMTEDKKITGSSDICEVSYTTKGKWTAPKIIKNKSINTSFFEGAATLTADGNTMYFVSDRKGEKTGTDIYVVQKINGKTWGEAKILPAQINTPFAETTPFISPDGRFLFFSSEGHTGMGGYDIFVCENTGSSWSEPINLGGGINSVNNETHFFYSKALNKIYFAGYNFTGQKGNIDIYEIDMTNFKLPVNM